jgi:hypothetical protein
MTIRSDRLTFDPDCYCGEGVPVDEDGMCTGPKALQNKLGDWNEWYVDIHSKKCKKHIQKVMKKRIKAAVTVLTPTMWTRYVAFTFSMTIC